MVPILADLRGKLYDGKYLKDFFDSINSYQSFFSCCDVNWLDLVQFIFYHWLLFIFYSKKKKWSTAIRKQSE